MYMYHTYTTYIQHSYTHITSNLLQFTDLQLLPGYYIFMSVQITELNPVHVHTAPASVCTTQYTCVHKVVVSLSNNYWQHRVVYYTTMRVLQFFFTSINLPTWHSARYSLQFYIPSPRWRSFFVSIIIIAKDHCTLAHRLNRTRHQT